MNKPTKTQSGGQTIASIAITFFRGLYVFGLTWVIAFVIWWPIAAPAERLIYWIPRMPTMVSGSPESYTMWSDLIGAVLFGPLMDLMVLGGYFTVVVTAAVMAILLWLWPPSRSKWRPVLFGVVSALLTSPVTIANSVQQTGSGTPNIDAETLWRLFALFGYPFACAIAGYQMGKPLREGTEGKKA